MIKLLRVDDRLIHGQVATRWSTGLKVNRIMVIDDAVAANAFAEDVQNALHAGMTAHFAKPIDASVLEQMLYKYLR